MIEWEHGMHVPDSNRWSFIPQHHAMWERSEEERKRDIDEWESKPEKKKAPTPPVPRKERPPRGDRIRVDPDEADSLMRVMAAHGIQWQDLADVTGRKKGTTAREWFDQKTTVDLPTWETVRSYIREKSEAGTSPGTVASNAQEPQG